MIIAPVNAYERSPFSEVRMHREQVTRICSVVRSQSRGTAILLKQRLIFGQEGKMMISRADMNAMEPLKQ